MSKNYSDKEKRYPFAEFLPKNSLHNHKFQKKGGEISPFVLNPSLLTYAPNPTHEKKFCILNHNINFSPTSSPVVMLCVLALPVGWYE
jgi:hypothetical protein